MYRKFLKRIIGFLIAFVGIVVLAVPMLVIAILIRIDSKGPVIFKQVRLGKNRKEFTIYKFRTMINNAYEIGGIANSSTDSRITKVGAILRRTSLDELPQMFNILKGDMAIIGPRPILPIEFAEFEGDVKYEEYDRRHDILPGLFCTVDIDYRASASRELQFEMDLEYIENMSLMTDIKYCFQIVKTVLSGKNVYREEE